MKKVLILLIVVIMTLGLVSCAKTVQEKAAEKIAEKILEENLGGSVDVDINNNDETTITFSEGEEEVVIQGSENGVPWPSNNLPSNVPELKGVTVLSVMDADVNVIVAFEGCDKGEAEAYREKMTDAGWSVTMDMQDTEGGTVMMSNDANEALMFTWSAEEEGVLTYSQAQ